MIKSFDKLNFGTGGIPISTKERNTIEGIKRIKKLNLSSMELEFVRNANISKDKTSLVKEEAKKQDVLLSCHGSYYVNLNAKEQATIKASIARMINDSTIAYLSGAFSICHHVAYNMKEVPETVFKNVKDNLKLVLKELKDNNIQIWLRPETGGKLTQFGSLQELIKISQDLDQVLPCIDFSHHHARSNGKFNSYEEYCQILSELENGLGKDILKNMHIHAQGIKYSEKGEIHHLEIKESDFKYKELMKALKDFNVKGTLISESPNLETDALIMQKAYLALK